MSGATAVAPAGSAAREHGAERSPLQRPDDVWPRTTRLMPWGIAAFLAMMWLLPFDSIELGVALPFDSKLDRLAIAALALLWLFTIGGGGSDGPRWRAVNLHAAVAALAAVCVLSVVLDHAVLANLDQFGLAIKKLSLLASFVLLYAIVASSIRPAELRPFAFLLVGLAVIAAIGTIYEYRSGFNAFYEFAVDLLPGGLRVAAEPADQAFVRPQVVGPTGHGLAIATLLAMALPFAVVSLLDAASRRRALVAIATVVIIAGAVATLRKTAIVLPVAAVAVILAYRPRGATRVLAAAVALVVAIRTIAPDALSGVGYQFRTGITQSSTNDRTDDYAAIAPDVLSDPVLGRGFGSYDPHAFRTLDNEILVLLVEIGVVGLAFYLLMLVAIALTADRAARRAPGRAGDVPVAIVAAVVVFAASNLLFDALAFRQVPYLLFFIAGLAAVSSSLHAGRAVTPRGSPTAAALPAATRTGGPVRRQPARTPVASPVTVFLVGSSGGHLDLLTSLEDVFEQCRRVWVTSEGTRAAALAERGEEVRLLPEFGRSPWGLARAFRAAARLVDRERPSLVVTSGAGLAVPFSLLARARGSWLVFIETMARVSTPSASGRVLSRAADTVIVQWPEMARVYPTAAVCRPALVDSIGELGSRDGTGTFVALGTHSQPFDRLLATVDRAVVAGLLPEPVQAQVGVSGHRSEQVAAEPFLSPERFAAAVAESRYVVCHAGSGIISSALRAGHRPIVMPRLAAEGEHVDDHQLEIAGKLAAAGLVVVADGEITREHLALADAPGGPRGEAGRLPSVEETLRSEIGWALGGEAPDMVGLADRDDARRMVVVVCFLDEETTLPITLETLAEQARPPDRLLLVDDGSSDRSPELAERFAAVHDYARVLRRPPRRRQRDRLASAAELRAFQWACERLDEPWDVLVKLDADLRLTPDFLGALERELAADDRLGIVGAHLSVLTPEGAPQRERVPVEHVRGATKFYRRECYEQIAPILPILGWDTADEMKARMLGWHTRSVSVPSGDPIHLRPTGAHDGALRAQRRWGECAYGFGAHPMQVIGGAALRALRRPLLLGGLNYLYGWLRAAVRQAPRAEPEVRRYARRELARRLLALPSRQGGRR